MIVVSCKATVSLLVHNSILDLLFYLQLWERSGSVFMYLLPGFLLNMDEVLLV